MIFDETVTGFRYSLGGAQEFFGVVPDIATFGKGMANGYPLSAVVGRDKVMQKVEDIFFSGTFGGETLSLAAANRVIDKYREEKVAEYLNNLGGYLLSELKKLINDHDLNDFFYVSGHPAWIFLHIKGQVKYSTFEIKTFFLQEVFKRGVLVLGTHNLSFSHTKEDIEKLLTVYNEVLPMIKQNINNQTLLKNIHGEILKPLFKVR